MRRLLQMALALCVAGSATQANAAWYEAKSKHFIIDSDTSLKEVGDYAKKLERFDQAVRMARSMNDPALTDAGKVRIFFVRNINEWKDLTGGGGLLGEYQSRSSGSYAFVPQIKANGPGDFNSDILFFHEYAHHLMFQNWAVVLPTWITEGFAEFLSTAKINDDGSVTFGAAADHRSAGVYAPHHDYSLADMLSDSERDLTDWKVELIYSRGWLLTHYLTFEPSRRGQLDKYIAGIQNGETAAASAGEAFGDISVLDKELDRYAEQKKIPGIVVPPDEAKLGPITVLELPPGESALMPIQMVDDFGVPKERVKIVAGEARKLAASYPSDAFAQAVLAQAEYNAEYYPAAEAAADRALAIDPNCLQALIYKGSAEMELAKSNPANADWKSIREWFVKANHVATEDAQPLILYYESFQRAHERPTANAIKGLDYALILAPQDQVARWMAVRQYLADGRPADAKITFGPIIHDPHETGLRAKAEQVLSAMDSGNNATALKEMDAVEQEWKLN